jgi:hypothetical protein
MDTKGRPEGCDAWRTALRPEFDTFRAIPRGDGVPLTLHAADRRFLPFIARRPADNAGERF